MFDKIVLATDISPAWDEIVACAGEFKALGASEIILTHVITVLFLGGLEATLRAEAEPKLEKQKQFLQGQGFKVSVEIPVGLPAYSINDVARRHGADLIVVGSHGKSLWREAVLGCFTCAVLYHTQYPTMLLNVFLKKEMPKGSCRLETTQLLRHVLFPTDFSEISLRARDVVSRLAPRGLSQITLLNALGMPGGETYPPGFQEMAETLARDSLASWTAGLKSAGVPKVEAVFDPGHPLPAILRVLE